MVEKVTGFVLVADTLCDQEFADWPGVKTAYDTMLAAGGKAAIFHADFGPNDLPITTNDPDWRSGVELIVTRQAEELEAIAVIAEMILEDAADGWGRGTEDWVKDIHRRAKEAVLPDAQALARAARKLREERNLFSNKLAQMNTGEPVRYWRELFRYVDRFGQPDMTDEAPGFPREEAVMVRIPSWLLRAARIAVEAADMEVRDGNN